MAGLLTQIDHSVWKESTFLHFKEPKGRISRRTIVSVSFPWFVHLNPFLSVNLLKQSRPDLFWGSIWRPPLAVVSSWFPPVLANLTFSIHCSASARTCGGIPGPPRLLIPPHSHIWSFNVQLGPVLRVSSASLFSFTPHPPFNLPSFCFFPPPLLLLLLSLSLVQDQGLTAPVSGDRGRDHLVRGTSLQILPNSGRL